MEEKIVQFMEDRFYWLFGSLLFMQIVGALSIIFLWLFIVGAAGGLDIMEFDPPGLNVACNMLPFVFPFTLMTFLSYPRLKARKWARWLLIFTVLLNTVLAVPLGMVWLMLLLIFL
jgi:hypothetical protein